MASDFPYRKLLLPIDFSDDSKRAVDYGLKMAAASSAEVVLLTVIDDSFPHPELFAWGHPEEEFYRSTRKRALENMKEMQSQGPAGIDAERVVVRGRPGTEIVAVAEELGVDLVVLARRAVSELRTAIMGRTTDTVLRTSSVPVLVLPPRTSTPGPEGE